MTVKVNLYGGNIEGEVVDEGATTTGGGWEGVGEFLEPPKSTGGGSRPPASGYPRSPASECDGHPRSPA